MAVYSELKAVTVRFLAKAPELSVDGNGGDCLGAVNPEGFGGNIGYGDFQQTIFQIGPDMTLSTVVVIGLVQGICNADDQFQIFKIIVGDMSGGCLQHGDHGIFPQEHGDYFNILGIMDPFSTVELSAVFQICPDTLRQIDMVLLLVKDRSNQHRPKYRLFPLK